MIRYSYLWRSEAERGQDEGIKDRPCAVVMAVKREGQNTRVYVAPITHTPPQDKRYAVEIPAQTKARLKLDDAQSWIVTNEVNVFTWPGPDIRPASAGNPREGIVFGYLPFKTARQVAESVRERVREGQGRIVERDEVPPKNRNDRAKAAQAPAPTPSQPTNEPKSVRDYWSDRAKAADDRKPKQAPNRARSKDPDRER